MPEYIDSPLETDPNESFDEMVAELQTFWPDWQPDEANLDTQLLRAAAQLSASDRQTATSALTSIFRWFGLYLVPDAQPEDAVAATGTVTVVLTDTAEAHTIPAGTTYGAMAGGELLGFEVVTDQLFAAADPTTRAGVDVIATIAGEVGNGLSGVLEQVDALEFVESVTFEAATSGGLEAEDDTAYLDRLRTLLTLQAPRPIVPTDFAVIARNLAGVERAVAVDGYDPADHATYDPDDPSTWKERFVTVSAVDVNGEDVGVAIRGAIDVLFNGSPSQGIRGKREVNFVVEVIAPTYTSIDVTFTAVAWPTWAPADVEAQAEAAIASYLSPATWGQPTFGEARAWENVRQVTIDGLYATLRSVEGLKNVTALTFRKTGGTLAATPVTLDGSPGPVLTRPGTISGTVT